MGLISDAITRKGRKKKQDKLTATSIALDYPQEGELLTSPRYTFRISAGQGLQQIEMSLNGNSWQPCRASSGFWWYDWHGGPSGIQILLARGETDTGEKVVSARRHFTLQL